MPTRTLAADRSSLLAVTGSSELGGGNDDHLPIGGPWGGYTFRGVVRFALDWTNVRRINSARLYMRTSSQVHVGFSSAPDIYVRRATTSWNPNSGQSGADSGGGPGWSTSPVVYPGPSTTTAGQASKRMPTAESTWTDVDITAIVRAWAPLAIEGGTYQANYGVVLLGVASGDVSEVQSSKSVYAPYIVLDYASDAPPPAPTITGPTGVVTTVRPTLAATCVDPDGDPLTLADIEVRKAGVVVYSALGTAVASATTIAHVPTADLPSGALVVRMRAQANGVWGAWSGDAPFTVDRPPAMGAWTAPAASVSGTRRPVHTVAWSDPDADAGEVFDIEVYPAAGGVPVSGAAPAYAKTNLTTGLAAASISHTPAADLPGGDLVARVRVRTAGVWSAWSTWRAYTVVLTVPTLAWITPAAPGGFLAPDVYADLADPAIALLAMRFRYEFSSVPASGTTLTRAHVKIVRLDGPTPGSVYADADIAIPPAGGIAGYNVVPNAGTVGAAWTTPYGTVEITVDVFASNGGTIRDVRVGRFAAGEWYGAVALGDQVAGLAAVETPLLDRVYMLYRAQTAPTVGTAPWRALAALATVQAELPATNAYLGIRARIGRKTLDADLVVNGSFEDATLAGWSSVNAQKTSIIDSGAPDGSRVLRILGDGVANFPSVYQDCLVVPGATYRVSGQVARAAGTVGQRIRVDAYLGAVSVTTGAINLSRAASGWGYLEGWYTVPADGSIDRLRVLLYIDAAAPPAVNDLRFDAVRLQGMGPGDAGMDRLDLAWASLG